MSGVVFSDSVPVLVGLSQGCVPVGPAHEITEVEDGAITGLDGGDPVDVFRTEVDAAMARHGPTAYPVNSLHAAFPTPGSDRSDDYMVRDLIGIDPRRRCILVAGEVAEGRLIRFVRRDPAAAAADLVRMARTVRARLNGPAKGALYVSCMGRGPAMFGTENRELALIRDILGDVPLTGFYGHGEICHNRLYAYTGVLTLFV